MALAVKITTDHAALSNKLQQSVQRYPRAAAAGINRAARGAYTLSVREIQKDVGASAQKTIRRNLSLHDATAAKPEAQLIGFSAKKDRIPIIELGARPKTVTKRKPPVGVSYRGRAIPGSFVARMRSGHVGIFKRMTQPRLPIDELEGPSVALVFSRKKIQDAIAAYLRAKVPEEIQRAFRFVTG